MPFDGTPSARQQLLDAKDLLIRNGWCRGQRVNWRGEHCALGALDAAIGQMATGRDLAVVLLAQATGEDYTCPSDYKVAEFNNLQGDITSIISWFDRSLVLAE